MEMKNTPFMGGHNRVIRGIFALQFRRMLERLQKKWGVDPLQLFLILLTFALGGSTAGYLTKRIMSLLDMEPGVLWTITYIIIVTLLWPISVYTISILTGQMRFFSSYLKQMGEKIGLLRKQDKVGSQDERE